MAETIVDTLRPYQSINKDIYLQISTDVTTSSQVLHLDVYAMTRQFIHLCSLSYPLVTAGWQQSDFHRVVLGYLGQLPVRRHVQR